MIAFVRPMAPLNRYIQNVPLSYIHVAAYLRERGYTPLILDEIFDDMTPEAVDRTIREKNIQVVGIGAMTCEMPQAVTEAQRLKKAHPELKIVFGGPHPSGDPEECLRTGAVDYVIVGEGEIALANLLDALKAGGDGVDIPGVWSMRQDQISPGRRPPVPPSATVARSAH